MLPLLLSSALSCTPICSPSILSRLLPFSPFSTLESRRCLILSNTCIAFFFHRDLTIYVQHLGFFFLQLAHSCVRRSVSILYQNRSGASIIDFPSTFTPPSSLLLSPAPPCPLFVEMDMRYTSLCSWISRITFNLSSLHNITFLG